MNVLLLSRITEKTGVGNHMKLLAKTLSELDHKVVVASSVNTIDIDKYAKFETINFSTKNPIQLIKNLRKLHKLIKTENIDIVHCHHRIALFYMRLYNIFHKKKYVWTLHLAPIPVRKIDKFYLSKVSKIIAVSTEVKEFLIENVKINPNKIRVIINGVDDKELELPTDEEKVTIRKKYNIPSDKIVILQHARIDEIKNQIGMVEAFGELAKEDQDKLRIVFTGEERGSYCDDVKSLAKELNVLDKIIFTDWIDARTAIAMSDVLLSPSFKEGFMLSAIEAFLMKIPVIRTNTPGYNDMKEYCFECKTDKESIAAWYKKIIVDSEKMKQEKIELAYNFAINNCTASIMTKKVVDVYLEAIKKRKKS